MREFLIQVETQPDFARPDPTFSSFLHYPKSGESTIYCVCEGGQAQYLVVDPKKPSVDYPAAGHKNKGFALRGGAQFVLFIIAAEGFFSL